MSDSQGATDAVALDEAAEWAVRLSDANASDADLRALEKWRGARIENEVAWRRVEALNRSLESVSPPAAMVALAQPRERASRGAKRLSVVAILLFATAAAIHWPHFYRFPDYRTAVGESRNVELEDGTRLTLNTDSVVDVDYDDRERRIRLLRGEVFVESGHGAAAADRPLTVHNRDGRVTALGTVFTVIQDPRGSRVAVLEGAIRVESGAGVHGIVDAGATAGFAVDRFELQATSVRQLTAWREGMVFADEMPLGTLLDELGRYRPGLVQYDAAIADLPISGAFSIKDTDRALAAIARTLPVTVHKPMRYWVRVSAR